MFHCNRCFLIKKTVNSVLKDSYTSLQPRSQIRSMILSLISGNATMKELSKNRRVLCSSVSSNFR
ncbi:hypothetical protein I7I50_11309 [Histoplasma capsulatum G186AR]|uniref:Uncharacterized protein n=1 Tax=Ajellomyces capsulatus TaxID=5037 RepID=A0A8H7ZAZ2_AJECA|nr:hypothetical protein I7I52_02547 [Histoplasma capsulatum]QSS69872.1 hypothetical protein I7I50_11309 [Histoplasma capsulatum G186AR]